MIRSNLIKRRSKKPKFVVEVTCQGLSFYYEYGSMIGACIGYIKEYLKSRKYDNTYGTTKFAIKEYRSLPFWENI